MKLRLTVVVDATDDECEDVLDQLDELIEDQALQILNVGWARLVSYEELPAVGRERGD